MGECLPVTLEFFGPLNYALKQKGSSQCFEMLQVSKRMQTKSTFISSTGSFSATSL